MQATEVAQALAAEVAQDANADAANAANAASHKAWREWASRQTQKDLVGVYHIIVAEMRVRKAFLAREVSDAARHDVELQWDLMKSMCLGGHLPW